MNTDLVNEKTFKGTDLASQTRKRTGDNFGNIKVSYNYEQTDESSSKEVFILVEDALFKDKYSMVGLDPDVALELLHHLNDLLGKPMGYAAYAAG